MTTPASRGWTSNLDYGDKRLKTLPQITGQVLDGDVWVILNDLCERYPDYVRAIKRAQSWGFTPRKIAGTNTTSYHAYGLAVDLNASDLPQFRATMTAAEKAGAHKLRGRYLGVVRWGGDYPRSRLDQMHWEIIGTPAQVKRVADKIRADKGGTTTKPSTPTKPPADKPKPGATYPAAPSTEVTRSADWNTLLGEVGYTGRTVERRQRWLTKLGFYKGRIDNQWGPLTARAQQSFLKSRGFYKGLIDGKTGPLSKAAEVAYLNDQRKHLK